MSTSQNEIDSVVDELKWGHPETRKKAAIRLGRIRDQRVIPPLIKAMKTDKYSWTRISAIQSLLWIADPSVVDGIIEVVTSDPDKLVRKTGIEALGALKDKKAINILETIVNSNDDQDLRTAASIAIQFILGIIHS